MALPIVSNAYEVVSGGASNPRMISGTADPGAGGGVAAPEGSIYLRFVAAGGEVYFKNAAGNTDWTLVGAGGGGGGGTLDASYDFGGAGAGRIVTADSGAVQIEAATSNSQAGLFINRAAAGSSPSVGLAVTMTATGNAVSKAIDVADAGSGTSIRVVKTGGGFSVDVSLQNTGAQGIRVTPTVATTSSAVLLSSTITGATGELLTVSKIPAASTAGDAVAITMGANASGDALQIGHSGSGLAINVTSGDVSIGTVGTPVYVSPLEVGSNSNAQVTIRNNGAAAEVNVGVDGSTGWVGTATNHDFQLYSNDTTQWYVKTTGAFRSDRNLQPIETSIFDFSVEPGGAGTNGNYLAGGAGSAAAVSAVSTGRIRYNQIAQEWQKSENGGAWETLGGVATSSYERHASFGVPIGAGSQTATLGRTTFSGSLIGLSVHAEDATTAGTLTVNVKINAVTKLTAILNVGTPEAEFDVASIGDHVLAQGDEVTVEVVTDGSYDNTPSLSTGVVVNVAMIDGTGAAGSPNVAFLDVAQVFTAGQSIAQVTLGDGSGIAVNGDVSNNFQLELTQNSDLTNPTNVVAGQTINIAVRQNGAGGFTLAYGSSYLFPGGTPTISAGALAEDIISCYVREEAAGVATVMLCSIAQGHS